MDVSVKENARKVPKESMRSFLLTELQQEDLEELSLSIKEM